VTRSTFKHNTAPSNGCIYADVKAVLIANSTFYNNSALSDSAGALQLDCIENAPCYFTVTSNNFSANSAGLKGGAVYWTKQQPSFINNSYSDNSAVYGPDVASFGIKVKSMDFDESQGKLSKVSGESYVNIGVDRDSLSLSS
jgi:predicted outer membrane repeat protein